MVDHSLVQAQAAGSASTAQVQAGGSAAAQQGAVQPAGGEPSGAAAGAAAGAAGEAGEAPQEQPAAVAVAAEEGDEEQQQAQEQEAAPVGAAPPAAAAAAAPAAAAAAAPAAAAAEEEAAGPSEERPSKRSRIETELAQQPCFAYEPKGECDLVLKTSDGRRIGVHRLIVARTCGFFRELLEACGDETTVSVAELYDTIKPLLLDVIYDRSVPIQASTAVQIFSLADKYEAPSLMLACRNVFASDAFKLGIAPCSAGSLTGQLNWTDMLSLASKHQYKDVLDKCVAFFLQQCQEKPALALESFVRDLDLLPLMLPDDLLALVSGMAKCCLKMEGKTAQELQKSKASQAVAEAELAKSQKQLEHHKGTYIKLLGKYNRLLEACKKNQVTFLQDLEPKKKGKKPAAGGAAGAAPAVAAAADAVAAVVEAVNALLE